MAYQQYFSAGQVFVVNEDSKYIGAGVKPGFERFTEAYQINFDQRKKEWILKEIKEYIELNLALTGVIIPLADDSDIVKTIKARDNKIIQPGAVPPGVRAN